MRMAILSILKHFLGSPINYTLYLLNKKHAFDWISNDELFLKLKYRAYLNRRLDLKEPKTFNEKLQWLKLYNRKPEYTLMVDKYEVKKYVSERVGEEFVIPTLGVWNKVEDIDWDILPNQFVLKTTHGGGGGGVCICRDKSTFDIQKACNELNKSMEQDLFREFREWPYKNVPRKIIAEKFMIDESGKDIKDYKFFCFNGKVEFCKVDFERFVDHHANYYSPKWSLLPFGEVVCTPDFNKEVDCPSNFDKMLKVAEGLAKEIPFARIDLYNIKGRIYFGEITFFPAGGMGEFTPVKTDEEIGQLLKLPNNGGGI